MLATTNCTRACAPMTVYAGSKASMPGLPELDSLRQANDGALFDLIVGDVSFISLTLTLPPLLALLRPGGHILHLVKPQFEVGGKALAVAGW